MTDFLIAPKVPLSAAAVVADDLDYMVTALGAELHKLAGKRLLITGGAGFLGYYLVQLPLHYNRGVAADQQIEVTVFDNYARGVPDWLTSIEDDPQLTLIRHDVIQPLPADMDEYDYIIHAAGIASPTYYRQFPLETMDANINGLRSLLDYCRESESSPRPVQGMLFFSSSEIYGDPAPECIPTAEDYRGNVSCTGPRACYDESKRYGETLCVTFARQYGTPVSMARPFNNYGPGLKITDRRVIPDFARDIFAGRDLTLLSNGAPTRTFCYVADAVVGYYKTLVVGRPGEAYNIGVETPEISVRQLADMLAQQGRELFGYEGAVVQSLSAEQDYLIDNPQRRCPNIQKARTELNYDPQVDLSTGLRRSLLWYVDHRVAEDA